MEWFGMVSRPSNLFPYFKTCLISKRCVQLAFFNLTEAANCKILNCLISLVINTYRNSVAQSLGFRRDCHVYSNTKRTKPKFVVCPPAERTLAMSLRIQQEFEDFIAKEGCSFLSGFLILLTFKYQQSLFTKYL